MAEAPWIRSERALRLRQLEAQPEARGTLQDEVRRICQETGQTVFMITHDVDEAIYLADRIVLMTNGPGAVLAEIVENPLPKQRLRADIHRHPLYYVVRNHIIDFLVSRSRNGR